MTKPSERAMEAALCPGCGKPMREDICDPATLRRIAESRAAEHDHFVANLLNGAATAIDKARAEGLAMAASRAREIAEMYSPGSDGRNTFVLMAEWCEEPGRLAAVGGENG